MPEETNVQNTDWTPMDVSASETDKAPQSTSSSDAASGEVKEAVSAEPSTPDANIPQAGESYDWLANYGIVGEESLKKLKEQADSAPDNPFLKELITYAKKEGADIPLFVQLQSMDADKMSDIELLATRLQIEDGIPRDKAERALSHKYKLAKDGDDYVYPEEDRQVAEIELLKAVRDSKRWLKETQQNSRIPDKEKERLKELGNIAKAKTDNLGMWQKDMPRIVSTIKPLNFDTGLKDEKNAAINYDFAFNKPEAMTEIKEHIKSFYEQFDYPYDEEGIEIAKEYAINSYFNTHRVEMMRGLVSWCNDLFKKQKAIELHNPNYKSKDVMDDSLAKNQQNTDWEEMK